MHFVLSILFLIVSTASINAQETWKITKVPMASFPQSVVEETRVAAPLGDSLPDGLLATNAKGDIREAWYSAPTTRYNHGVLGDTVEGGMLKVKTSRGITLRLRLPSTEVFEDRAPRLVDLDGNGSIEIVTIRSSTTKGAAVTIYGLKSGVLKQLASTKFIGRSNRWLNIAGIDSYAGVRGKEIAYVITPHIGGKLAFIKYYRGKLLRIAIADGFSNHVIGSREMRLSASLDVTGDKKPDLAVPSADRTKLKIVSIGKNGPKIVQTISLPAPINKAIATTANGSKKDFTVGLENGEVYQVSR